MTISSRALAATAALLSLALVAPAQASTSSGVHVTNVAPNNAGALVFYVDAPRTGLPACAAGGSALAWTVNTNTVAGQVLASALFTALSTGMLVDIGGTGACDVYPNAESAGYIAVRKP
ncbi:hypothetical protein [Caulobacter sp. UNC279MFTsu5.1]|uniref:hypothetical protein n=1 Tax=Caulobacter sp. UNC279MFTsu5.1 TaxID=1502775 RepID=UPI000418C288|nr:hypothetical protein [Caulobacter sp. UNC279MFTsu5.1]SFK25804.1 hypothetical protein SAMN02799626_03815 [Caulobacter sp. UNC279MFTsu5.1]